jgi:hypothetical protein
VHREGVSDETLLVRRLIGGDLNLAAEFEAATTTSPRVLVAAALVGGNGGELLARAMASATTRGDRQLVAIAAAELAGDRDLVDALVRDHLLDHPGDVLAAWIAAHHTQPTHEEPK